MNTVIVAAAGRGSRMNSKINKQFLCIGNIPVLAHTLKNLSESVLVDNIIIAARKEDFESINSLINEFNITKVISITEGGATRQESVYNALKLVDNEDVVLIHDGARPFFSDKLLNELISQTKITGAAAPGIVPKDTIAVVDGDCFFEKITERSSLRCIQTPQVFMAELVKKAHENARNDKKEFTDDCSVFCYYGGKIKIINGEENNIKITVPEDLKFAEMILKSNKV